MGKAGREILKQRLPRIKETCGVDLIVANGENMAEGAGLAPSHLGEILSAGVDIVTTGDHVWDRREIIPVIGTETRLLRPANYPDGAAGRGSAIIKTPSGVSVAILNLQGRVFMFKQYLDDPFRRGREETERLRAQTPVVIVDFHAEATSEKMALGWFLDGLASAVLGTHTHVQTADERVLPGGTAYITDAGMNGPTESVIGLNRERVFERFMTQMASRWKVADGPVQINGVLIEVDEKTGRALSIERIREFHGERP